MAEEENQDLDVLSPDQYQNRLVDFYRQTLGSTGIQTTKPEEDDDKEEEYVAPQVVPDQDSDDGMSGLPVLNISGKVSVLDFTDTTRSILEMDLPRTYQEHLERNNREDKSDFSKLEKAFNNQTSKLQAEFNKNAQKNFGIGIDLPDAKQAQKYAGTQMLGTMLGVANPFEQTEDIIDRIRDVLFNINLRGDFFPDIENPLDTDFFPNVVAQANQIIGNNPTNAALAAAPAAGFVGQSNVNIDPVTKLTAAEEIYLDPTEKVYRKNQRTNTRLT